MRRGLTLIEMMTTVAILAIAGAATLPLLNAMADTYAASARVGADLEKAMFAMERMVRTFREVPLDGAAGRVGIREVGPSRVVLSDGSGFALVGQTLMMLSGPDLVPLCTDVEVFELEFLAADGVSSTAARPHESATVRVLLRSGGIELRSVAMIRAQIGGEP